MRSHFIDEDTGMEKLYLIALGVHSFLPSFKHLWNTNMYKSWGKTILHPVLLQHSGSALLSISQSAFTFISTFLLYFLVIELFKKRLIPNCL